MIVQKMLEYLHQSKEEYIIVNLVGKIAELAEKYPLFGPWVIKYLLLHSDFKMISIDMFTGKLNSKTQQ